MPHVTHGAIALDRNVRPTSGWPWDVILQDGHSCPSLPSVGQECPTYKWAVQGRDSVGWTFLSVSPIGRTGMSDLRLQQRFFPLS